MNDIFLGIWRNIDRFDEEKGSFAGWAAGAARLEAIDMLRRIKRQPQTVSLEDVEIPREDPAFEELAEQELSREAEEILACLQPKDQELFRRIFLEEEEPETAGDALGNPLPGGAGPVPGLGAAGHRSAYQRTDCVRQ